MPTAHSQIRCFLSCVIFHPNLQNQSQITVEQTKLDLELSIWREQSGPSLCTLGGPSYTANFLWLCPFSSTQTWATWDCCHTLLFDTLITTQLNTEPTSTGLGKKSMTTQNIGPDIFLQASFVSVLWLLWVKNAKPSKTGEWQHLYSVTRDLSLGSSGHGCLWCVKWCWV